MQEVLEFILKNITTVPDDVAVEAKDEGGVTNYTVSVNADDVGRVIGKEGKVIKAIRTIMRVIAIQKGVRVRVSVLSDNGPAASDDNSDDDSVTIEEPASQAEEEAPTTDTEEEPVAETTEEAPATESAEESLSVEV